MYISGMPGTGKTATTVDTISKIIDESRYNRNKRKFDFLHINAMSLQFRNNNYNHFQENTSIMNKDAKQDKPEEDPMISINEDYSQKQFGKIAEHGEMDLYKVSGMVTNEV